MLRDALLKLGMAFAQVSRGDGHKVGGGGGEYCRLLPDRQTNSENNEKRHKVRQLYIEKT